MHPPSFNRAWSQRVGLMDESYLGQGRSLGASRLLFEIGARGGRRPGPASAPRLDSGYLSRLLRGLEEERLVDVRPDPADQRRRVVVPTAKGRRAIDRLEERSEERARALVDPLGDVAASTADRRAGDRRAAHPLGDVHGRVRSTSRRTEAVAAVRRYFDELDRRFSDGFDAGEAATSDLEAMCSAVR